MPQTGTFPDSRGDLECGFSRHCGIAEEYQSHSVAGRQANGRVEVRCCADDLLQLRQALGLPFDGHQRVTHQIHKQHVPHLHSLMARRRARRARYRRCRQRSSQASYEFARSLIPLPRVRSHALGDNAGCGAEWRQSVQQWLPLQDHRLLRRFDRGLPRDHLGANQGEGVDVALRARLSP